MRWDSCGAANRRAFGSVYKGNLARSVIQAEAIECGEGTLTVRLRQKKHNFGPLAEPFSVKLAFSDEAVTLQAVELKASELAEEITLTATERVRLALEGGPAYPWEITETTGIPLKRVKNVLTRLRKQGVGEPTGATEGQADQVRLRVLRPSASGDGTRDADDSLTSIQSEQQVFDLSRERSCLNQNRGAE